MKKFIKKISNFIDNNIVGFLIITTFILSIRIHQLQYKVNKLIFEINENFRIYNQNVIKEEIIFKAISKKLGGK